MHCLSKRHTYTVCPKTCQALIKMYYLIIILWPWNSDYMWFNKEFIYFHYTIIQVVTSNQWTHSCNNLSLTDTDLLHDDVVVNSFPQGKILNIHLSSKGGGSPLTMKKMGPLNFCF